MKKAIIGAGGFAREVKAYLDEPTTFMFVDDIYYTPNKEYILPLSKFDPSTYEVVVAIGNPQSRFSMVKKLPPETKYFTFIHPTSQIYSPLENIGEGSIICPNSIITTNVFLGNHTHLNLLTTIGHDCEIDDYFTTAPGAKISGNCEIGMGVYIGTNASVKEKLKICSQTTVGLNAGVVKDINKPGTYIGTPAKKI
jgi:sugar O-acyltransferase (sialic acid O-acetyltransferase NeuD family)